MTRLHRLLRLARLRGDKAAIAILEGRCRVLIPNEDGDPEACGWAHHPALHAWTETELRAAWGDR